MVLFSSSPVRVIHRLDPVDLLFCLALDHQLAPLKRAGRISSWQEGQIDPGPEGEGVREKPFSIARLFLLSSGLIFWLHSQAGNNSR